MKRRKLIKHLKSEGCFLRREGGSHSIWENPKNNKRTSVPRHIEISDFTAKAICKQLEIKII